MFWSDTSSDRIFRAWLNGTGVATLVTSGLSVVGTCEFVEGSSLVTP